MKTCKRILFISLMFVSLAAFAGAACDTAMENVRQFESLDNGTAQMRQFIEQQRAQANLICSGEQLNDSISGRSKRSSRSDEDDCDRALARWPDSRIDREIPQDSTACDTDPSSAQCCAERRSSLEFDRDMEACSAMNERVMDRKSLELMRKAHERNVSNYNQYCTGRSAPSTSSSTAPAPRHEEASSTSNLVPDRSFSNSSSSAPVQFMNSCIHTYDFELNTGKMDPVGTGRYYYENTCSFTVQSMVCVRQKESPNQRVWFCEHDKLRPGEKVMHGLGTAKLGPNNSINTTKIACKEDHPESYMSPCGNKITEWLLKTREEHY